MGPWCVFVGSHERALRYVDPADLITVVPLDQTSMNIGTARVHGSARWLLVEAGKDEVLERIVLRLRSNTFGARLAVLGPADDAENCERWLRRGAQVYATDNIASDRLRDMMLTSENLGIVSFDDCLQAGRRLAMVPQAESLTEREKEILRHLQMGRRNAEIARDCFISVHTVEFHLRNIYGKLGVSSRLEAAVLARELGL